MTEELPPVAGVNSFGFGGTNAHVILSEPPVRNASSGSRGKQLLLLSAKSRTSLDAMTENLRSYLETHPETSLADAAYTLQVGRRSFKHRRLIVGGTHQEVIDAIASKDAVLIGTRELHETAPGVVFMFPGQGSQYVGMLRDLFVTFPGLQRYLELDPAARKALAKALPALTDAAMRNVRPRFVRLYTVVPAGGGSVLQVGALLAHWGYATQYHVVHQAGVEIIALLQSGQQVVQQPNWSGLVQATVFFTFAPWGSYCVKYQCRWHLCLLDFLDSVTEITEGIVNSSQSRMAMCKRTINPRSYFRVSPL